MTRQSDSETKVRSPLQVWRIAEEKECPTIRRIFGSASCGFPSPAMDYQSDDISITELFAPRREATEIINAQGNSMLDAGICEGDWLFVDRSIEPRDGHIVLAWLDGEFLVKRLRIVGGKPELHPENEHEHYPVIRPSEYEHFTIEGVVVSSGRRYLV